MSFREKLTCEECLVLRSLKTRVDDEPLPGHVDPTRLIALADRHRVAGLVERHLSTAAGARPVWYAEATDALAARRETAITAFLGQMCALVSVDRALTSAGTRYAVLKGPSLLRLYDHEVDRHPGDLDILLGRPGDAEAAIEALLSEGWNAGERWVGWNARRRRRYMAERKDLTLTRDTRFAPLELHWRPLQRRNAAFPGTPDSRLVTRRAGGWRFPGLADVDEAAYLMQHATQHGWTRLKWLADIVRAEEALGERDAIAARSRAFPEPGQRRARVLAEQLIEEVNGASHAPGAGARAAKPRDATARRRALAGTLMDLPMSKGVLRDPSDTALQTRRARLALALSLAPGHERVKLIAVAATRLLGSVLRHGSTASRRRRLAPRP